MIPRPAAGRASLGPPVAVRSQSRRGLGDPGPAAVLVGVRLGREFVGDEATNREVTLPHLGDGAPRLVDRELVGVEHEEEGGVVLERVAGEREVVAALRGGR